MTVHIYEALKEKCADVMETGFEKAWAVFENRMRGQPLNDMYGIILPSQGWDTPKLHSKVSYYSSVLIRGCSLMIDMCMMHDAIR